MRDTFIRKPTMIKNHLRNICLIALTLLTVNMPIAIAAPGWADSKANLSLFEYLSLYFTSHIKPHTADEKVESYFIANSSPQKAILYLVLPIVVPESDLPTRANLNESLKKKANLFVDHVNGLLQESSIAKRWKGATTKQNLIIHFVDSHDRKKTVGLFESGKVELMNQITKEKLLKIKAKVGSKFAK